MYRKRPTRYAQMTDDESVEVFTDEIKRRFAKSFLDILILQLIESEATWGYGIIKKTEADYKVKLRHGALYPMLSILEKKGYITSRKELEKGRQRKIYEITSEGRKLLKSYHDFLRDQDSKRNGKTREKTK
jgi:DNA-binding PadR family transcriptional regulator